MSHDVAKDIVMSGQFLLSECQMARASRCFPQSHRVQRVDDRRGVSAIVYVIKHGQQRKKAPQG
jgi:hypothetical protein